jgi:glycosyltransferase involved in cell wall biosynthesis
MRSVAKNITLAMIAKNEERNIERCLCSALGLAEELIVVDTGSSDRTKEIAINCGAKVFDFPWIDDFSAARNRPRTQPKADGFLFWMLMSIPLIALKPSKQLLQICRIRTEPIIK